MKDEESIHYILKHSKIQIGSYYTYKHPKFETYKRKIISVRLLHDDNNVTLARVEKNKKIEPFRDPEWQANTFAAELLVPLDLIDTQNIYEIAENFGVSNQVAEIRLNKLSQ